jgi:hypothetical protein
MVKLGKTLKTKKLTMDMMNFLGVLQTIMNMFYANPDDSILKAQTIYCLQLLIENYKNCKLNTSERINPLF